MVDMTLKSRNYFLSKSFMDSVSHCLRPVNSSPDILSE